MRWPPPVEAALRSLESAGLRGLVVGGALRDRLLERPLRDVDLLVDAPYAEVVRALPHAIPIAGDPPLLLVRAPDGGCEVQVTTLRRGALDLVSDLEQRDFTINAIALDPRSEEWLDPTNGRADLDARQLRSARPREAFRADPLRVLRGIRLAAELDLSLDQETRAGMERDSWRLARVPGERLQTELFRLLELDAPAPALRELRGVGALAAVLPELLRQVGVSQNRHHPDDVYTHTLRVCDGVRADPTLRLAALLHDVAKADTKRFGSRQGDFTFLRHDVRAAPFVRRVASRLRLSKDRARVLERLVRHHLLFPRQLRSGAAVRRMVRRVGADILDDLLELRRSDLASRTRDARAPAEWDETVERIARESRKRSGEPLAIGGKDVMRCLGIGEGPEVGRWLGRARRRVIERPEENQADRLLAWIRESRDREGAETCTRR